MDTLISTSHRQRDSWIAAREPAESLRNATRTESRYSDIRLGHELGDTRADPAFLVEEFLLERSKSPSEQPLLPVHPAGHAAHTPNFNACLSIAVLSSPSNSGLTATLMSIVPSSRFRRRRAPFACGFHGCRFFLKSHPLRVL